MSFRARARTAAAGAVVLVVLTGCASAPHRELADAGVAVPDAWGTPASAAEPASDWIASFGEPGLVAAVGRALERNHDLLAAAARVEAAAAEARIAGADLLPSVSAGANASRRGQTFVGFPIPGRENTPLTTITNSFGVSLDVSWEADFWGRLRAARRAALAEHAAGGEDRRALALSLAGQTAKAWFAVVEARLQRDLAESTLDAWRRSLESVERRYRRGLVGPLDLRLARSNVASAESLVALRRDALERAERQLRLLEGDYPAAGAELLPADLPPLPQPVPAGLPAELVARRPDLRAAEHRLSAAGLRVAAARAARYPSFTLTASGGAASNDLQDVLRGDFSVWNLGAALFAPLFAGGRLAAQVERADALSREALHRFASATLAAFREVENALASERHLRRRAEALDQAAREADAALALAQRQYEQGLVDYPTVLDAQRRALAARSELLAVRREALTNRVDLHLALGGDFAVSSDPQQTAGVSPEAEAMSR
ncbi:MAG: multidrug efflux RND transporter outer membrane channel subunit OprM [Acidobacteriota bacterium]